MILITGADGFIGQHLTRKLLDDGHAIRTLSREDSPLYIFSPEEVDRKKADITVKEELCGAMDDIDTVYHLAAISRNDLNMTREDFFAVNVQGTVNLLEAAQKAGVKKFVFISTVEAAGFGNGKDPREENDAPQPTNNYGKSKLEAEQIVLSDSWAMECTVLRLPMIYGPGTFLIVPKLFGMVRRGYYPLIGDGSAKMEFCFVENAVKAIILAGKKDEASGELFYVSDSRSYSIKEVVSTIANAMDKKIRFVSIPIWMANLTGLSWEIAAKLFPFPPVVSKYSKKPFFSRETVFWTTRDVNIVSTEKIKGLPGYSPDVTIEQGCRKTAQWLKARLWQQA